MKEGVGNQWSWESVCSEAEKSDDTPNSKSNTKLRLWWIEKLLKGGQKNHKKAEEAIMR